MPGRDVLGAVRRFWRKSYAADYTGFILLLIAYFLVQYFIEPFHRMFSLDNQAIQFPHAERERVPVSWLFGYALGVPLVTLILWTVLSRSGTHKAHVTILGLFVSLILTSFLTDVIKNSVGRPRPDLLMRCKPKKGTSVHALVTFEVCTETNQHVLHDGWRSFPSGHSSFAFSGLGYLALFLAGQIHLFRPGADLARVLLVLAPLVGAALIAISRCEDYRHDVYDVTVGSLLGFLVAHHTYRRYYPALKSANCDVPFSKPVDTTSAGFTRLKDEEERAQSAGMYSLGDPNEDGEADIPLRELGRRENGGGPQ